MTSSLYSQKHFLNASKDYSRQKHKESQNKNKT